MPLTTSSSKLLDTTATPIDIRGVNSDLTYDEAQGGSWKPIVTEVGQLAGGANLIALNLSGLSRFELKTILDECVLQDLLVIAGFTEDEFYANDLEPDSPTPPPPLQTLQEFIDQDYGDHVILRFVDEYTTSEDWVDRARQRIRRLRVIGHTCPIAVPLRVAQAARQSEFENAIQRAEVIGQADVDQNTLCFARIDPQFANRLDLMGGLNLPVVGAIHKQDLTNIEALRTDVLTAGWVVIEEDHGLPDLQGLVITKASFS